MEIIVNNLLVIWNALDNRERALTIWIFVFLIWITFNKAVRDSMFSVLKAFFSIKILIPFCLMFVYIITLIFVAYKLQIWESYLLKDTIILGFVIGFTMFLNINKANSENNYFKKTILESIKLTVILEFIVNLYVFSLPIEIVLVPILAILTVMLVVSSTKKEFEPVKKLLNLVLAIIGIYFLYHALMSISSSFGNFATLKNLKEFLLLPFLTIAYIPFIYFLALYSAYESLFVRVNFLNKGDKKEKKSVKLQIFKNNLFNLIKLNNFSKNYNPFLGKD